MDYLERINQNEMNLVFSYSVTEDEMSDHKGCKFLGAGWDKDGREVHVFEIMNQEDFVKHLINRRKQNG